MTIGITFDGCDPIIIHSWELKPTKNHKYETTIKGSAANKENATRITYPIYLQSMETAIPHSEPESELSIEEVGQLTVPRAPHSISNVTEYYVDNLSVKEFDFMSFDDTLIELTDINYMHFL